MGFKLQTGPMTAEATVNIHHPVDGETTFKGQFRILKHSEYQKLIQAKKDDVHVIEQILVGWSEVLNDDGKEIPFSKDVLRQLCEYVFVRTAIMRAYTDLHVGFAAKN